MSIGDMLTVLVVVIGLALLFVEFGTMAAANFSDPTNGAKQWLQGMLEVGIASTLVLVGIGAMGVVAAVLSFILSIAGKRAD